MRFTALTFYGLSRWAFTSSFGDCIGTDLLARVEAGVDVTPASARGQRATNGVEIGIHVLPKLLLI